MADADLSAASSIGAWYRTREIPGQFPEPLQEKAEAHGDTVAAVGFGASAQTGRKAKAARGNRPVAGQGSTCPAEGLDVKRQVTGIPHHDISRYSLHS